MRGLRITRQEIDYVLASLAGLSISHVGRGDGSTVFLELGLLRPYTHRKGEYSVQGEMSLMIGRSWRVEKTRSIWFGAFSDQEKIDSRLPKLAGRSITTAVLEGRLPELHLAFSGDLWLSSFMGEQGQQEWVISNSNHSYYAKAQNFYKESKIGLTRR